MHPDFLRFLADEHRAELMKASQRYRQRPRFRRPRLTRPAPRSLG